MKDVARSSALLGLSIGAIGLTSLGLQPQMLEASGGAGVPADQAGLLCTAEMLAMAIGAFLGFFPLCSRWGRPVLILGGVAMACGHGLGGLVNHLSLLFPSRALAGAGEGIMATAGILAILDSRAPVRTSGLFLGLTALPQIAATGLVGLVPALHGGGVFFILSGLGWLGSLLAAPPRPTVRVARPSCPTPQAAAAISLFAMLNMTGSACWSYLEVWAQAIMPADGFASQATPVCLLAQIGGSLLIAWRGSAQGSTTGLIVTMLAEAVAMWAMGHAMTGAGLLLAATLFGFTWQAGLSLATGMFSRADPRLGAACFILPFGLAGIAAGPALASAVPAGHLGTIFTISSLALATLVWAQILYLWVRRHGRRRAYS